MPIIWNGVFQTWKVRQLVPKVHISSPKSEKAYRSHADYVSLDFILPFLKLAKSLDQDFDMMIEAKQKNLAMHQLVEDIAKIRGVSEYQEHQLYGEAIDCQ